MQAVHTAVNEENIVNQKMVYLYHRCFLLSRDPLQLDNAKFPHNNVCDLSAPEPKTQKYVDDVNKTYSSLKNAKTRVEYARTTGCTGYSALRSLDHHDRHLNTPVEPVHLVKGISEHIVKIR